MDRPVFGSGLRTKCPQQPMQTCFCCEEKFTQWSIAAMQYCTRILGHHRGVQPFSNSVRGEGEAAPSLAELWPGDIQSFLRFPLIPQSNQTARRSHLWYALFIRPPGRASGRPGSRPVNISARWTRINNCASCVSQSWAASCDFCGHFWGKKRPLSRWVPLNEMLIKGRREEQEDQKGKLITLHSCFQVSTSQFCPPRPFCLDTLVSKEQKDSEKLNFEI